MSDKDADLPVPRPLDVSPLCVRPVKVFGDITILEKTLYVATESYIFVHVSIKE